jgi:hypothetical protein
MTAYAKEVGFEDDVLLRCPDLPVISMTALGTYAQLCISALMTSFLIMHSASAAREMWSELEALN